MSGSSDKDRIDWLERHCVIIAQEPKDADQNPGTWAIGPSGNFQLWAECKNSAREAIDHAMRNHP